MAILHYIMLHMRGKQKFVGFCWPTEQIPTRKITWDIFYKLPFYYVCKSNFYCRLETLR